MLQHLICSVWAGMGMHIDRSIKDYGPKLLLVNFVKKIKIYFILENIFTNYNRIIASTCSVDCSEPVFNWLAAVTLI